MIHGFIIQPERDRFFRIPIEDSFRLDFRQRLLVVADGVTRDSHESLPNTSGFFGKLRSSISYPRPSPAKEISDMFAFCFPYCLASFSKKDQGAIRKSFEDINQNAIQKYNDINFPNPNFLTKDKAACVASAAVIDPPYVYFGFIADCGVAVISEDGSVQKTEDQGPERYDKLIWDSEEFRGKSWRHPDTRINLLKRYRNNPNEPLSFGVLNGEPEAMHYVTTGTFELKKGDLIMAYSDGMASLLFDLNGRLKPKFTDIFANGCNGLEDLCKQEAVSEGTLVYSRYL